MMKKFILSIGFWTLLSSVNVNAQDIIFSFTVNNNDPTNSVVSLFAQFDGSGNNNAVGYTAVFYYNNAEASSVLANVSMAPTTALGWNNAPNDTYSNIASSNPNVPIVFTNRIEIATFDNNFVGTNFTTTPTLLATITFVKTPGDPITGGDVYIGATIDTDPGIVYFDNTFAGHAVQITGIREALLPLTLVSFEADKFGDRSSILSWSTASEINSSHFVVQRSTDRKSWTTLGKVGAAGNSQFIENYEFVDQNVYNGLDSRLSVYYRLQMVDLDGQTKTSPIENVVFGNSNATGREFVLYPNPASDGVQIEWDAEAADQPTALEFYDVTGKLIHTQKVSDNTNQEYVDFQYTNIKSGIYLVRIMNGTESIEIKQIVVGHNK